MLGATYEIRVAGLVPRALIQGLGDVSVATRPASWAAAVQARPGACFYLHLTDGGEVLYGVGTVCTGATAMNATDPRW